MAKAGGIPLLIPHLEEKFWPYLMARFDGFILSGGGDVSPLILNEEPLSGQGEIFPPRDQMELYLARQSLVRNIPVSYTHLLSLRVFPALLPLQHPLASVYNEFNALFVEGNAVGELMFYGKGAGALPTASAVVSDIIDAARCLTYGLKNGMPSIPLRDTRIVPGDEMCSSFYLRLQAQDRPGVFASVATAFGDEDVSLDMILQKRSDAGTCLLYTSRCV